MNWREFWETRIKDPARCHACGALRSPVRWRYSESCRGPICVSRKECERKQGMHPRQRAIVFEDGDSR